MDDERRRRCEVCRTDTGATPPTVLTIAGDRRYSAVLCRTHSDELERTVTAWHVSRTALHSADPMAGGRRLRDDEAAEQIRAWAIEQGLPVARHGSSLSQAVIQAYRDAHLRPAQAR